MDNIDDELGINTFSYFWKTTGSTIFFIIIIVFILGVILFLSFNSLVFGKEFLRPTCYVEKNYFINEEIKQSDLCPNGCLYIYSYKLLANDPHILEKKYRKVYKTYYFAKEQELKFSENIKSNEEFNVRWCGIRGVGERIRGVWK